MTANGYTLNLKKCQKLEKVKYTPNPKFGTVFAPHLLRMTFHSETKNFEAEIVPFQSEMMSPATLVLHYGQSIFEGMKAYRQKNGRVAIFRSDLHAKRFYNSAVKMAMAPVPVEIFEKLLNEYVAFEQESVPSEAEHSLYLRPLLFARDEIVKLGPSKSYTFYIMSTIAGRYFSPTGITPAKVLVNRSYIRAFPGGTGEAKTAGNYAASLMPQAQAIKLGCDQVLYLDAEKHEYVDELGGMNFFMVRGNELVTPKLNGAILHGVTRRSILEIAPLFGFTPKEEPISFLKLIEDINNNVVQECFACGTAATVHPIGEFLFQRNSESAVEKIKLPEKYTTGLKMLEAISAIHRGQMESPGKWLFEV